MMCRQVRNLTRFAILAVVLALAGVAEVAATSNTSTLGYQLGTGTLAGLPTEHVHGPVVAKAANGDTIELTGTGTLTTHPKTVTGNGQFTHKAADGAVLGSGTWTATQLLSFTSYGSGSVQGLPPQNEGGKALLRIHLSPGLDAILQVDCLLGTPPAGAREGIRLAVQQALNFNKEVSGETLFVRQ
jgi:hypothetical protein